MTSYFNFFRKATGGREPYAFQQRFAEAPELPHLLRAPTGSGKTATAVVGWLYRWENRKQFPATPRRLVYCLPMRVLVEQSKRAADGWVDRLKLDIPVHALMGGVDSEAWFLNPEKPAILIGTQDMLLSRALNRGYAASRFHWPMDFGLLNNDCLWIFDEPQLMGGGVSTSAQMAGFRRSLGSFSPCPSVWMSATLEPSWLQTIDFRGKFLAPPQELQDDDYEDERLNKRMAAAKTLAKFGAISSKDMKDVAKQSLKVHQAGTQTLVVVNTVERAKALYKALGEVKKKEKHKEVNTLLVHSRFRPHERDKLNTELQATGDAAKDRIIVATQVVEAGVDISARILVTELAPWASIVQRIGRCNRTGDDGKEEDPAEVFWIDLDEKAAGPYEVEDLAFARPHLQSLEGKSVSPKALDDFKKKNKIELPFEHKHVLRRRDLLNLFDTAPDLSGNDIDIARYIRGEDPDTDVQVFWRDGPPSDEWTAATLRKQVARREELCNVPIRSFKEDFLSADKIAFRWDFLDEVWRRLGKRDAGSVVPGQVFWIGAEEGGYDEEVGWDPGSAKAVPVVPSPDAPPDVVPESASFDGDEMSHFGWRTIAGHTDDVMAELNALLDEAQGLLLCATEKELLRTAVRWHDWGKAHAIFQSAIKADGRPTGWDSTEIAKAPDDFWGHSKRSLGNGSLVRVRRFRHELASALGVLALFRAGKLPEDWSQLSPADRETAVYLVASHHGKVRLSIRTMPDEEPVPGDPEKTLFACGLWDGDKLPAVRLGEKAVAPEAVVLDLTPMQLGGDSWTARALSLRDRLGPFRLAYLEALVRAADCRASARAMLTKEGQS
jgi:CRISPR-associated endonuclease/helicase Cas3